MRFKGIISMLIGLGLVLLVYAYTDVDYYNGDNNGRTSYSMNTWKGQTFTASKTYTAKRVSWRIDRFGSTPGTTTVSIRATSSGLPSGGDLCNQTFADSGVTSTLKWHNVTFASGCSLTSGTVYALVVRSTIDGVGDYMEWSYDNTAPSYAGGSLVYSTNAGGTWTALTGYDMNFKIQEDDTPDPCAYTSGDKTFESNCTITSNLATSRNTIKANGKNTVKINGAYNLK